MPLTAEEVMELKVERGRRDHAAFWIGVATAEWRRNIVKAEKTIRESEQKERTAGDRILKAHGFDPQGGEYTFHLDSGRILRLVQSDGEARWADAETGEVLPREVNP